MLTDANVGMCGYLGMCDRSKSQGVYCLSGVLLMGDDRGIRGISNFEKLWPEIPAVNLTIRQRLMVAEICEV